MAYLVDQQTIMFYKRLQSSENIVLRVLGRVVDYNMMQLLPAFQNINMVFVLYAAQYLTLNNDLVELYEKCSDVTRLYFIFFLLVFY